MLVGNTLDVECLIQSLTSYLDAKTAHDKARDEYQGYSWGYHGHNYVVACEETAADFAKRLDALIEAKLIEQLEKLRVPNV